MKSAEEIRNKIIGIRSKLIHKNKLLKTFQLIYLLDELLKWIEED